MGGYRNGERSLAYPLAGSTGTGDLVIADRGFWSVEFAHAFTAAGADLLVRLQSHHLGTAQEELRDGSYLSMARPGKDVRLPAAREGRTLPKHVIYRVITFAKDDKVAYLGTTLLDPEQYPAAELVALSRETYHSIVQPPPVKKNHDADGPHPARQSAGVERQYSGTAGRTENCQIGTFLSYASSKGPALIDRELCLPVPWTDDRERCRTAGIGDKAPFATKNEDFKWMLLQRAIDARVPFAWVTAVHRSSRTLSCTSPRSMRRTIGRAS
ncbi:hypothetical protein RKD23_000090 [Streptomyces sp. SAI-170]